MHDASIDRVQAMAKALYPDDMSKEMHTLIVSVLDGVLLNNYTLLY